MNVTRTANYFWPHPLGPWGGVKRPYIIKFQLQRFLNQTMCVFSQIKATNISGGIFIQSPGVVGLRGQFFFSKIQPNLVCELLT